MARSRLVPGDGSAVIVVLLLASLAVAAVVAWQAQDAARSHRAMAESVLRDYAALAADELIRRATSQVGYYGYYRLIGALGAAAEASPGAPPPPEAVRDSADETVRDAGALVGYTFRFDPARGELTVAGPAPPAAVRDWLRAALPAALGEAGDERPLRALHGLVGGAPQTVVFARPRGDRQGPALGFGVDRAALGARLAQAAAMAPLLPPSLGDGAWHDQDLEVRIDDLDGTPLYAAGAGDAAPSYLYPPRLAAERPFGDSYGGILDGVTVRVAIDPAAAGKLVIGGLPRSRLPLLAGLLALTAGLVVSAIAQLRRARRLTRLRADFVSQVSHELRTPLTQIRMFAETLLLGRVRSADEGRRSLEIIDQEARRLGHLVENILQFSRGERGTLELAVAAHELAPLVRAVVDDVAPLARGRLVRVVAEVLPGVRAEVDPGALRQILLNLLDNAIKYGPPEQEIRVEMSCSEVDETVEIAVDDQGPGVPRRDRQRVWQSYRRLERDRRAAVAGTGIGLAVVRELVTLHGGRARVEAGSRGGARFVVALPRLQEGAGGRVAAPRPVAPAPKAEPAS